MGSRLATLTSSDIQRFERDGYVVLRQAFSRARRQGLSGSVLAAIARPGVCRRIFPFYRTFRRVRHGVRAAGSMIGCT
jgi:hypothetical protein